jgi:hypothetical protein
MDANERQLFVSIRVHLRLIRILRRNCIIICVNLCNLQIFNSEFGVLRFARVFF